MECTGPSAGSITKQTKQNMVRLLYFSNVVFRFKVDQIQTNESKNENVNSLPIKLLVLSISRYLACSLTFDDTEEVTNILSDKNI